MSIRRSGYQFVRANPDAQPYSPFLEFTAPAKVDLRPLMTPVESQGPINSCTANAITGAYEYLIKKHTGKHVDLSRLFIYYNARLRSGDQAQDCGSVIQYGMESLQGFGACQETVWPYNPNIVLKRPVRESYAEAEKFRVLDMLQVDVDLGKWRSCLAEGYPIVFGCALFETFDDCNANNGVVPMPDPKDVERGEHGRHAMLCVGYSDIDRVFIVRNSWGDDWGDAGYCYMPYNYLMSKKLNGGDCWIIRSAENLPSPDETWVEDNRPLLRGFEPRNVNRFPANAYDRIAQVLFGGDADPYYALDLPTEFVALLESLVTEWSYVEDDDDFRSYESEEEIEELETDVDDNEENSLDPSEVEDEDEADDEYDDDDDFAGEEDELDGDDDDYEVDGDGDEDDQEAVDDGDGDEDEDEVDADDDDSDEEDDGDDDLDEETDGDDQADHVNEDDDVAEDDDDG